MKIAVFGLGKLGLPLAEILAHSSHWVIGVDTNQSLVDSLNNGSYQTTEPMLSNLLSTSNTNITFTTEASSAALDCEAVFIIVPTPSLSDGSFSSEIVVQTARVIGQSIRETNNYKLVVLVSTVMPGTTDYVLIPALEKESGKACNKDFGVCYNPEFIALGSVIHDMCNPDFTLIGESHEYAGDVLELIHNAISSTPVIRMNPVSAEIAKLAVNCYVTTKISFANSLAELCNYIYGANVRKVTEAIGHDRRIGKAYLQAGTAFGGPCFPRDNRAYINLARGLDIVADIPQATEAINHRMSQRLADLTRQYLVGPSTIALLGLAYKPGTPITEESAAAQLLPYLSEEHDIVGWDPIIHSKTDPNLHSVNIAGSLEECVANADIILVLNNCPEFAFIPHTKATVVIDPWAIVHPESIPGIKHIQWGSPCQS